MGLRTPPFEYYDNEANIHVPPESVSEEALRLIKSRRIGITTLEIMNS